MALTNYAKYLAAKKTVDDRALNADVLRCLRTRIQAGGDRELRVLELGAGLGTMPARLIELDILRRASYTLLDADISLLEESSRWLSDWARTRKVPFREEQGTLYLHNTIEMRKDNRDISEVVLDPTARHQYDVLIANAVLDLFDVSRILPLLLSLLKPTGTFWFSINFDGESIFMPEHAHDGPLLDAYHRSMDERTGHGFAGGNSRTGRRLFQQLREAGATVMAAGSSDWVVYGQEGSYPHEEAEFLHCIVQTIQEQLHREIGIDRSHVEDWVATRRKQIERGELVYVAHQLDFVGGIRAESA